jgi:hypothetical protein
VQCFAGETPVAAPPPRNMQVGGAFAEQYADYTAAGRAATCEVDLEQLLEWCLEQEHPGWEINDGGRGTITVDVPARKVTIDHHPRWSSWD